MSCCLLASACGGGDESNAQGAGSEAESLSTVATSTAPDGIIEADYPARGDNLLQHLEQVQDGTESLVSATVRHATGDVVGLDVGDIVVSGGEIERSYETVNAWQGVEVGDEALILVRSNGSVESVAIWDPSTGEPREPLSQWDEIGWLGAPDLLEAFWSAPSAACGVPIPDPGYADPSEVIIAYLEGITPRQQWEASQAPHEAAMKVAESMDLNANVPADSVTGESAPIDEWHIYRQLVAGVDRKDVTIQPTVPVFLDAGGLTERTTFTMLDAAAGYYLGWLEVSPGETTGGQDTLVAYFNQPASGNDVVIVTHKRRAVVGCITEAERADRLIEVGEELARIPHDDFAGQRRLRIDLATGEYVGITAEDYAAGNAG